ncbi:class I SAM-dependent methyltransferase [Hyphomicrobium sp. 99]|uniref:class I SAM-dependent methyltransferase n=1 Tax=Hyphomicrobium sp. 99 TaxID=1163419 RepID=UPI0005F767DC|nr:class I SAM-dependent methyltransferase [Hyphomicrobium sp. 99]
MNQETASDYRAEAQEITPHRCRLCGSKVERTFVDLGMSPLCESFVPPNRADDMEPFYPLHALVCGECFLVQLKEYVSPENIFEEYAYFSSYSTSWVSHAKAYTEMIIERLSLGSESLAVELASNDGYLLQHFLPFGIPVLGVEPAANVAQTAIRKGIPTEVDFFGVRVAQDLARRFGQADLIAGNNVLAQVPDLNDFVAGIRVLLKPEGIVTLEFPHLQRLMEENQFDTIYHEHFSYFSLLTIEKMAARHQLKLVDVEELSTHGGSLRVYLAHEQSNQKPTKSVEALLQREESLGFRDLDTYSSFGEQVTRTKRRLLSFLIKAKEEGKTICGYGAPGKGNTLLNYCGIGLDFLEFTVDRNPYKLGRLTPGTRIPIRSIDAIDAIKPDLVLILPWNLKQEIIAQMRHIGEWGGKFVVPIPEVTVVDPREFSL